MIHLLYNGQLKSYCIHLIGVKIVGMLCHTSNMIKRNSCYVDARNRVPHGTHALSGLPL